MKAMAAMGGMGLGKMGPGMKIGPGMAGRQGKSLAGEGLPAEAVEKRAPSNRFRIHTENTGELMASLVDFSRANSLKMNILNIHPPSLEDAFVMLTGEAKHEK
ncbi:MAG: hypothetical protein JW882_20620, partial [Deltaproteobacteria bacterium]|nr:hypothetical protein [Deltaproteobacteria bacterium]